MTYYFLKTCAFIVGRMNSRVLEAGAQIFAFILFDILRVRRRTIIKNLKLALGDERTEADLTRIGRQSTYHFLLTILEFLRSSQHNISGHVKIDGQMHIDKALSKQQGAYVLCFHLGNWEAMGSAITRNIKPAHVLVKKVGTNGIQRFVSELRDHNQFLTVKRQKKGDGFIAIQNTLAKGEIIGFVMDQSRPGEPRLPFFGHPARTNTSLAAIWRRHPAPIVPACIHRTSLGKHVLEIFPELGLSIGTNQNQEILDHSTYFNTVIEKHIRAHPDQYFWMHNRWK